MDNMRCPLCGCTMYKDVPREGAQYWVCTDPDCGKVVEENDGNS